MAKILFDSKSGQVIVHRSDGKRLLDLFEALGGRDGFGVAISDHAALLGDQLRDADVLAIATRIPPAVGEQYAKLLERCFGSRDTEPLGYQPEEVEAITSFVAGGGGLLLMTNHGDLPLPGGATGTDWTHRDRVLADAFGVTIESAWFPGPIPNTVASIEGDCLLANHKIMRVRPAKRPCGTS